MKRKKYYYLDPVIIRIPGIKTLFEKSVGKRDARQNQVCSNGEVHTTPFIDAKVKIANSPENGIPALCSVSAELSNQFIALRQNMIYNPDADAKAALQTLQDQMQATMDAK